MRRRPQAAPLSASSHVSVSLRKPLSAELPTMGAVTVRGDWPTGQALGNGPRPHGYLACGDFNDISVLSKSCYGRNLAADRRLSAKYRQKTGEIQLGPITRGRCA